MESPTSPTSPASKQMRSLGVETITKSIKELYHLQVLGQGGFGYVYKARRIEQPNGVKVALKQITARDPQRFNSIIREIRFMRMLSNINDSHFIQITHAYQRKTHDNLGNQQREFYIEMELADGDLSDFMNSDYYGRKARKDDLICDIALDVAQALIIMHGRKHIHADLKPENIMYFSNPRAFTFKLGDFGLACDAPCFEHQGGTSGYIDPMVACFDTYRLNEASDMYSFGVILYNMFADSVYMVGTLCGYEVIYHYNSMIASPPKNDYWKLIYNLLQPFTPEKRLSAKAAFDVLNGRKANLTIPYEPQTTEMYQLQKAKYAGATKPITAAPVAPTPSTPAACKRSSKSAVLSLIRGIKKDHHELCDDPFTFDTLQSDLIDLGIMDKPHVDEILKRYKTDIQKLI